MRKTRAFRNPTRQRRILVLALACLLDTASAHARPAEAPDVLRLVMRTPHGGFNRMVMSLAVCEPGSDRCATIDDVMVDTGSTGLRLEASAVPAWLRLPPVLGPNGRPVAECLRFVHDTAWGPLARADVRLGGLVAAGLPLQVIDDRGGPQPDACPRSDAHATSNGTLGIGQHLFDCQGACEQSIDAPGVFVADGGAWVPVVGAVEPAYRLPNPVSRLPGHDNGIVIDLPSPLGGGSAEVVGTLTFGVGPAADNQLGAAGVLRLDASGRFTTVFDGRTFPESTIDSGTETLILDDDRLPRCPATPWAYCVAPVRHLGAEMVGRNGNRSSVGFAVGDYGARRAQHAGAAADVAVTAEPRSPSFVWGAPFFLGRTVLLVMDGRSVPGFPGITGPFYAVGQGRDRISKSPTR